MTDKFGLIKAFNLRYHMLIFFGKKIIGKFTGLKSLKIIL